VSKQLSAQRKALESRLPAHMIDILNLATAELGGSTDFIQHLMKYYIHLLVSDEKQAGTLANYLNSDLALGKADKRLSLKGCKIYDEVDSLKSTTHISSTTALMKSIILKINDDLLVKRKTEPTAQLKHLIAAMA
jgi:predicted DNA-binding protein YlxM (UPF0122 family)